MDKVIQQKIWTDRGMGQDILLLRANVNSESSKPVPSAPRRPLIARTFGAPYKSLVLDDCSLLTLVELMVLGILGVQKATVQFSILTLLRKSSAVSGHVVVPVIPF